MNKFNGNHLFFILGGVAVVSMKTYPTLYTIIGGRDSWVAVIISSILILLFGYIITTICWKNNNYSIYDIYCSALGKTWGNIFIWIYILTLFLTLIEASSIEANAMHVNMLPKTPPWFFLIFFVIPAIYTISRGTNAIVIVTIIGITLITLSGMNLGILTQKYKHFSYLFPILKNGINRDFILTIVKSLGFYAGAGILLPYLSEFKNENGIRKHTLWTLVFIVQMEIYSTIGIISTFDYKRLNAIYYPKLIQTQLINYFGFLESGELYVLLQTVGGWFVKYILTFYAILIILKRMKLNNNLITYIVSAIVLIISYFCSRTTFTLFSLLDIYVYIVLINFIVIPLIIYIIFYMKHKNAA